MKVNNNISRDYFIWERFRQGDKNALSEIYKSHYTSLLDYGLRIRRDREFIQECIQELFFYLISNIKSLGPIYNLRAYLLASLRRKIFNEIRNREKMQPTETNLVPQFDFELSQEEIMVDQESSRKRKSELKKILNKLPAREKEAVYLKFYKDMSYEEITSVMGISYDSARKFVYRAIKNLREMSHSKVMDFLKPM